MSFLFFVKRGLLAIGACALLVTGLQAHGPQIQVTGESGKIVTREIVLDGPYSDSLTPPKSVYVMPALPYNGGWYSRPNTEVDAVDPTLPVFYSGPGVAFGFDQADGGSQVFATGSKFLLTLNGGLRKWIGGAFADAGVAEMEAFRTGAAARTTDGGTSSALDFPAAGIADGYGADGAEAHATLRYRFLGDGSNVTSPLDDGVYLLQMQLASTDTALSASDPFYFVLNKNSSAETVGRAVASLGVPAGAIQYVPEPTGAMLLSIVGMFALLLIGVRRR